MNELQRIAELESEVTSLKWALYCALKFVHSTGSDGRCRFCGAIPELPRHAVNCPVAMAHGEQEEEKGDE